MATKARFYKLTTKNGHGENTVIISAPKKSVIPAVFENENVKVTQVEHLGFQRVDTVENDNMSDVKFIVPDLNGLTIQNNDIGFKSLSIQFDEQVSEVYKDLDKYHNG